MKTAGNGRKGLADRLDNDGDLFGGELDGLHPSRGPQQAAEQPHVPKAGEPQNRQVSDQVNYETLDCGKSTQHPFSHSVPPNKRLSG
jgi:hypothetical protein